jgi:hypothetical protein
LQKFLLFQKLMLLEQLQMTTLKCSKFSELKLQDKA